MRCPKCGYISFDRLEACLKCKKDISAASEALQGGVLHVTPPVFLNLQPEEDQSDGHGLAAEGEGFEDEVLDGDLDILIDAESAEGSEEGVVLDMDQYEEEESGSSDFEISSDKEPEISIDPSLFDNDVDIEDEVFDNQLDNVSEKGTGDFEIEMPEELADMSDLAPPAPSEDTKSSSLDSSDDSNSLSIDLDSLDFDLDSDVPAGDKSIESLGGEEDVVPLGDIDFSDTISGPGKEKSKKSGTMVMDDDLNFDLDLGGLSIHDDK